MANQTVGNCKALVAVLSSHENSEANPLPPSLKMVPGTISQQTRPRANAARQEGRVAAVGKGVPPSQSRRGLSPLSTSQWGNESLRTKWPQSSDAWQSAPGNHMSAGHEGMGNNGAQWFSPSRLSRRGEAGSWQGEQSEGDETFKLQSWQQAFSPPSNASGEKLAGAHCWEFMWGYTIKQGWATSRTRACSQGTWRMGRLQEWFGLRLQFSRGRVPGQTRDVPVTHSL